MNPFFYALNLLLTERLSVMLRGHPKCRITLAYSGYNQTFINVACNNSGTRFASLCHQFNGVEPQSGLLFKSTMT